VITNCEGHVTVEVIMWLPTADIFEHGDVVVFFDSVQDGIHSKLGFDQRIPTVDLNEQFNTVRSTVQMTLYIS